MMLLMHRRAMSSLLKRDELLKFEQSVVEYWSKGKLRVAVALKLNERGTGIYVRPISIRNANDEEQEEAIASIGVDQLVCRWPIELDKSMFESEQGLVSLHDSLHSAMRDGKTFARGVASESLWQRLIRPPNSISSLFSSQKARHRSRVTFRSIKDRIDSAVVADVLFGEHESLGPLFGAHLVLSDDNAHRFFRREPRVDGGFLLRNVQANRATEAMMAARKMHDGCFDALVDAGDWDTLRWLYFVEVWARCNHRNGFLKRFAAGLALEKRVADFLRHCGCEPSTHDAGALLERVGYWASVEAQGGDWPARALASAADVARDLEEAIALGNGDIARANAAHVLADPFATTRVDLRDVSVPIAIDPTGAQAIDDAFSIPSSAEVRRYYGAEAAALADEQSLITVDVHVCDATRWIAAGSFLERFAALRMRSLYLPDAMSMPMMPPDVLDVASLRADRANCAITVRMQIEPSGEIVRSSLFPSIIAPLVCLVPEQVELVLDAVERESSSDIVAAFEFLYRGTRDRSHISYRQGQIDALPVAGVEPSSRRRRRVSDDFDDDDDLERRVNSATERERRRLIARTLALARSTARRRLRVNRASVAHHFSTATMRKLGEAAVDAHVLAVAANQCVDDFMTKHNVAAPRLSAARYALATFNSPLRRYIDLIAHYHVKAALLSHFKAQGRIDAAGDCQIAVPPTSAGLTQRLRDSGVLANHSKQEHSRITSLKALQRAKVATARDAGEASAECGELLVDAQITDVTASGHAVVKLVEHPNIRCQVALPSRASSLLAVGQRICVAVTVVDASSSRIELEFRM
jgi:RNB domain